MARIRAAHLGIAGAAATLVSLIAAAPAWAADEPAGGAGIGEVIGATAGAAIATAGLFALGLGHRSGRTKILARVAKWASGVGKLPEWVAFPSGLLAGSLIVALLGMYWDISLHIDEGRDPGPLANPAHYLILFGLFGVFAAGFLAAALFPNRETETSVRLTRDWQVPLGSILICACGAFALIGFPLDDIWHRLFGQDVTLWGPTHLMLIGGASFALVGQAVLLAEGARARGVTEDPGEELPFQRLLRRAALAGAFLLGLSTFQAEFDFGVPQFDFAFQPILIALAAGMGLVSVRIWGGRGAALSAVAFFLAMRGFVALMVAGVWGETTPHFPLYLVEAVLVELVALRISSRRPLELGAAAGALIGTVGFAAEWGWSHVWMPLPWPSSLLPEAAIAALVAGVAGGVLGALIGTALHVPSRGLPSATRVALPVAALAVVAVVGYGLATSNPKGISATVGLTDVPGQSGGRHVNATVAVNPPGAAEDARWLTVTAWQGGGLVVNRLERVRRGVYRTTEPIPVYDGWKAHLRLHKNRALLGLPIYLPEDKAIPAPEVPAQAAFTRPFQDDRKLLQRESKAKGGGLPLLAYGTVVAIAVGLLALLAWGLARLARAGEETPPRDTPRGRPATTPRAAPATG